MAPVVGVFLSLTSVLIALESTSTEVSLVTKIVLWNIFSAKVLIDAGWVPACVACELFSLLVVLFYGFLIGVIGYSLIFFAITLFLRHVRGK